MPRGRNLILLAGQDWQSDLIGFCKGIAWKRVLEAEEERLNGHRMRESRYAPYFNSAAIGRKALDKKLAYDVRFWHLADMAQCAAHVRFWPKADMPPKIIAFPLPNRRNHSDAAILLGVDVTTHRFRCWTPVQLPVAVS